MARVGWRATVSALAFGFALGCSGLTEGAVEFLTGMRFEENEDGSIVITNPDGTTQVVNQGDSVTVPEGFPLPLPPGEAKLTSTILGEGKAANLVTFELTDDHETEALVTYYEAWFAEQGQTVKKEEQNMAGMRTTVLVAEGSRVQTVTVTEALGTRTLILGDGVKP